MQIIYEGILLLSVSRFKNHPHLYKPAHAPVSVVVCAKNEAQNLRDNLPFILQQKYQEFEVVVVNDDSTDETISVLNEFAAQYSNLKIITVDASEKKGIGKKYALSKGIKSAAHDIILMTDADCKPATEHWIQHMASRINGQHKIVLGISPYKEDNTILNGLIVYETMQTTLQYAGFAVLGSPYMGVGRNMCFDKKLWESKNWNAEEMNMASGDDDLAVQSLSTKENTVVCFSHESYTCSEPPKSWSAWFKQKMRHYETGSFYKASQRILLGSYLVFKLISYILLVACLFSMHTKAAVVLFLVCYALLGILTIIHIVSQRTLHMLSGWNGVIAYDFLYAFFAIVLGLTSLFKPTRSWK